jgi:hypothetical protein
VVGCGNYSKAATYQLGHTSKWHRRTPTVDGAPEKGVLTSMAYELGSRGRDWECGHIAVENGGRYVGIVPRLRVL